LAPAGWAAAGGAGGQPSGDVGAGGHGRDVLDAAEVDGRYDVLGLVDDGDVDEALLRRRGATFLGPVGTLAHLEASYVLAVGSGSLRRQLDERLTAWGCDAGFVVHPSVTFRR